MRAAPVRLLAVILQVIPMLTAALPRIQCTLSMPRPFGRTLSQRVKRTSLRSGLPAVVLLSMVFPACQYPSPALPPAPGPDPRNFTWTIDTIALPGSPATLMKSIWGSSSRNVYVLGHNDLPGGTMFRYDGTSWRPVNLTTSEGGTIQGTVELSQIFGFSGSDIFAVGGKSAAGSAPVASLVIHFDGASWSEMAVPPGGMLQGIWGLYNGEMWAAGVSGTLIQYIGLRWIPATFRDTASFTAIGGVSEDDVYALSYRVGTGVHDTTFRYLWHWNGAVWSILDSFPQVAGQPERFGTRSVWSLLAITYTTGQGFFERERSAWDLIIPGAQSGYLNAVYGNANNSLFVVGDQSAVFLVDPPDWYRYASFTDPAINYYGVWTDGREVFVVGNDGRKTYVLHGE